MNFVPHLSSWLGYATTSACGTPSARGQPETGRRSDACSRESAGHPAAKVLGQQQGEYAQQWNGHVVECFVQPATATKSEKHDQSAYRERASVVCASCIVSFPWFCSWMVPRDWSDVAASSSSWLQAQQGTAVDNFHRDHCSHCVSRFVQFRKMLQFAI